MRRALTPALISDFDKSAAYLALITFKGRFISECFSCGGGGAERGGEEDDGLNSRWFPAGLFSPAKLAFSFCLTSLSYHRTKCHGVIMKTGKVRFTWTSTKENKSCHRSESLEHSTLFYFVLPCKHMSRVSVPHSLTVAQIQNIFQFPPSAESCNRKRNFIPGRIWWNNLHYREHYVVQCYELPNIIA